MESVVAAASVLKSTRSLSGLIGMSSSRWKSLTSTLSTATRSPVRTVGLTGSPCTYVGHGIRTAECDNWPCCTGSGSEAYLWSVPCNMGQPMWALVAVRVADFRAIIEWIQKRIMDAGRS